MIRDEINSSYELMHVTSNANQFEKLSERDFNRKFSSALQAGAK